jgi:hypothetical protein
MEPQNTRNTLMGGGVLPGQDEAFDLKPGHRLRVTNDSALPVSVFCGSIFLSCCGTTLVGAGTGSRSHLIRF